MGWASRLYVVVGLASHKSKGMYVHWSCSRGNKVKARGTRRLVGKTIGRLVDASEEERLRVKGWKCRSLR